MAKSILAKTETGEVQLTITIPKEEVKQAYERVVAKTKTQAELPGFRKGKAPKELVEEKVDKSKIYEEVIQEIVPEAYIQSVQEHKVEPIISPKVELLKAQEDEDWEIRATTCEMPKVELGDYRTEIKKALAADKLWTPDKAAKKSDNKEADQDEKTQKVLDALLQTAKLDLPQILIENEVNRALSNLIGQTEKLGMTIDQYLNSIGKNVEQIRGEYQKKVEDELKMQFILDALVDAEKTEVQDKEIDDLIAASGDEKIKNDLNTPNSRAYLKGIISRRKTLDSLTNTIEV